MDEDDVIAEFERLQADDDPKTWEYGRFERVEGKRSGRKDLHALMLLDSLLPGTADAVGSAEHDQWWPGWEIGDLAPMLTPALILELYRCGVDYDDETNSLTSWA